MDLPDSVYEKGADAAYDKLDALGSNESWSFASAASRAVIDAVKDKIAQWGYVAGHEDGWQEGYSEGLKVGQREKKNDPA